MSTTFLLLSSRHTVHNAVRLRAKVQWLAEVQCKHRRLPLTVPGAKHTKHSSFLDFQKCPLFSTTAETHQVTVFPPVLVEKARFIRNQICYNRRIDYVPALPPGA